MSELPPGWEWSTLGEIGTYLNGRGFKKSEWSDSGRLIIRIQNLTGSSASFNHFAGEAEERHTVRDGDLLLSWAATLGVYVWRGPEAVLNQHIFKVESRIDPGFHRHLLDHVLADLKRQTHGSGMVHITKDRFDSMPIRVPPRAEQERIVAAVEEHLSRLDVAVAEAGGAASKLPRFRDATLDITYKADWPRLPLDDVNDSGRPICYGILKPKTSEPGVVPYVEVRSIADGVIKVDELHRTTQAMHEAFPRSALRPGDVVIAVRGSYDRAAVVPVDLVGANVSRDVARIAPTEGLLPEFLSAFLVSPEARRFFARHARGVAVQGINIGDLRALPTPVPSTQEQTAALDRLAEAKRAEDRVKVELRRVEARAGELRRSILAAAFSGQLVPQDPSDEPASVLLERIRADAARGTSGKRRRAGAAAG